MVNMLTQQVAWRDSSLQCILKILNGDTCNGEDNMQGWSDLSGQDGESSEVLDCLSPGQAVLLHIYITIF